MAAWTGAIENVILLLDMGVNINAIATRTHAYGKTPIFFAATRSRKDVMNLLLDRNANVRIVNNKGQSVYSIAASHFASDVVDRILQLEKEQQIHDGLDADSLDGWVDYKKSHPDGCVYGDLDLRFLGRELTDDDVVKHLVVNPTTKKSRKGNFAKNNPHLTDWRQPKIDQEDKKRLPPKPDFISEEDIVTLEKLWCQVRQSLRDNDSWSIFSTLLSIVQIFDGKKMNSSWAVDCAARLKLEAIMSCIEQNENQKSEGQGVQNTDLMSSILSEATIYCGNGDRYAVLVKRILTKTTEATESLDADYTSLSKYERIQMDLFWANAETALNSESYDEMFLSLIKIVILMDTKAGPWMFDLAKKLQTFLESSNASVDNVKRQLEISCDRYNNRQSMLLRKLLSKSIDRDNFTVKRSPKSCTQQKKKKKSDHSLPGHYKSTIKLLQRTPTTLLSWDILMNDSANPSYLSLPSRPIFVDSCTELECLQSKLQGIAMRSESEADLNLSHFVAFDTEWYSAATSTQLATVQLSILDEGIPSSWVVDLLCADNTPNNSMTCNLLRWLFVESELNLVGFAYKHDLHMLSTYIGQDITISEKYIDLQLLAAHQMMEEEDISSLPGLKSTCDYFLKFGAGAEKNWGDYSLSKKEQCSEWGRRPLSPSQLEYAGLDAAVLLVVLADIVRARS